MRREGRVGVRNRGKGGALFCIFPPRDLSASLSLPLDIDLDSAPLSAGKTIDSIANASQ